MKLSKLLVDMKLAKSISLARRQIAGGGVEINGRKIRVDAEVVFGK